MLNNNYSGIKLIDTLLKSKPYSLNYIEYSKNEKLKIEHHIDTNPIGLYLAENIFFYNKSLYDNSGKVIIEYDPLTEIKTYDKIARNKISKKDGFIYVFIEPRTKNYFHFYTQTVAALYITKQKYRCERKFIWVVGKLNIWKREILKALNVDLSCLMEINLYESYCFEEILISSFNLKLIDRKQGTNWAISHPVCYEFKDKILYGDNKAKDRLASAYAKKIYLSRSKIISHRNLKNENELENIVKKLGYEVIYPEKLSIIEQAKIFNNAEVVVGPTGAAFTNILFCKPGTKIGIIQGNTAKSTEGGYGVMAGVLDLKPYVYNAEFDLGNSNRVAIHDDYKIDLSLIHEFIIGVEKGFNRSVLKNVTIKGFYRKFQELSSDQIEKTFSLLNNISDTKDSADILREVALCFERNGDLDIAYKVMKKAFEIRPAGPFKN